MANNYIQGTVDPFLPLKPWHLAVRDCFWSFSPGELPPGLDLIDNKIVVEDEGAFRESIGYDDDLPKLLEGLQRLIACGDEIFNLHWEVASESGGLNFYVYAEDGLGNCDFEFLSWVIEDMPPEIRWITCEFATYCSKLRPGEFGGGAWFITRDGAETFFTDTWLSEQKMKMGAQD